MKKSIKLLKDLSLTWVLVVCASVVFCVNAAEAKHINPGLKLRPSNDTIYTPVATPASIMCSDCTAPMPTKQPQDKTASGRVWQPEVRNMANIFNQVEVLDIEWVLQTKNGKDVFWIVQARPYVGQK